MEMIISLKSRQIKGKNSLTLRLRLYRSGASKVGCLSEGGQEGVDIHVGEFLGLIRLPGMPLIGTKPAGARQAISREELCM